jgi:copper chaperone
MKKNVVLNVEGMSCEHCVMAIEKAVKELDGVYNVSVSLNDKNVSVDFNDDNLGEDTIKDAIEDQGYDVR